MGNKWERLQELLPHCKAILRGPHGVVLIELLNEQDNSQQTIVTIQKHAGTFIVELPLVVNSTAAYFKADNSEITCELVPSNSNPVTTDFRIDEAGAFTPTRFTVAKDLTAQFKQLSDRRVHVSSKHAICFIFNSPNTADYLVTLSGDCVILREWGTISMQGKIIVDTENSVLTIAESPTGVVVDAIGFSNTPKLQTIVTTQKLKQVLVYATT